MKKPKVKQPTVPVNFRFHPFIAEALQHAVGGAHGKTQTAILEKALCRLLKIKAPVRFSSSRQ